MQFVGHDTTARSRASLSGAMLSGSPGCQARWAADPPVQRAFGPLVCENMDMWLNGCGGITWEVSGKYKTELLSECMLLISIEFDHSVFSVRPCVLRSRRNGPNFQYGCEERCHICGWWDERYAIIYLSFVFQAK